MAIAIPNVINNITASQIVTQSGQACIPANLLDQNFSALANPVNPIITVAGSISLSTANSGNIYRLGSPNANATITLPTPTNGFNVIFVCNNSSNYTYTFLTPIGSIIWNNTTGSSVTPNTTSGVYFLVSDGTSYTLNSYGDITGVTSGTYGSSTQIPQVTVDTKGRIISATALSLFTAQNTVVFTSSGSWTVPQGVTTILVSGCAGGGGGGGGGTTNSSTGGAVSGAGGGAGQSVIKKSISVTPGHTITITIGSGGSGGAGGAAGGNNGAIGGNGGSTVLYDSTSSTTLLTLTGGSGGSGGSPNSGQAGAIGGGGYPKGGDSPDSTTLCGISGVGGSTPFGGGGTNSRAATSNAFAGSNGYSYGSGGAGGGASYYNTSYAGGAGGAGASGIMIIEW
jgi:hypothetical protein